MHRTMFNTPVLRHVMRALTGVFLKVTGWRAKSELPADVTRTVMIGAPHTSNWDMPYMLSVMLALRMDVYWMGKASLFRFPLGTVMKLMGGIPVNRGKSENVVATSIEALKNAKGALHLALSPEGTRARVTQWKTGFYYIATGAGVPILLGYLDYGNKVGGFGPLFHPTGDLEADLVTIKAYYAPIKGKNPNQFKLD